MYSLLGQLLISDPGTEETHYMSTFRHSGIQADQSLESTNKVLSCYSICINIMMCCNFYAYLAVTIDLLESSFCNFGHMAPPDKYSLCMEEGVHEQWTKSN